VRPHQYLKNGFIWLPVLFGNKLHDPAAVLKTSYAFFIFCFAASSMYIFNDLKDISIDLQHPKKKFRPLPSGDLSKTEALILFVVFLTITCFLSYLLLPDTCLGIIGGYIILNFAYTKFLKHFAIIDVICISVGFVLRVYAGGFAADIYISHWIVIMTFLLALFLGFAKRRNDIFLSESGYNTRKSIGGYNLEFVSASMVFMASVVIVSYLLYTLSPEVIEKHDTNKLYFTAFWVIIGLLRYMQLTFVENRGGEPTMILIKDHLLKAVIIFWALNIYLLLYL
jgi:4-hydroxybenzoate polyprenyltransferase